MATSLLADAFAHHVWATVRLIDACLELGDDRLGTTVPGVFGSILDTMRHTVGGDCSYLWVMSGGARPEIQEESMDLVALRAEMEQNGPAWASLLASDPDAEAQIVRHRDDGSDSFAPMGIRLAQALHHGTDHRSQICTAITSLGIEPPEIDAWAFGRMDGRAYQTEPST